MRTNSICGYCHLLYIEIEAHRDQILCLKNIIASQLKYEDEDYHASIGLSPVQ
jgi:hypothetical protein